MAVTSTLNRFYLLLLAVAIAGGGILYWQVRGRVPSIPANVVVVATDTTGFSGYYLGKPDAPVVITEYADPADEPGRPIPTGRTLCPYFRLVTMLVHPEKVDQFRTLYTDQVLPTLVEVPGCCYAQLVQNVRRANEFVSFSVWSTPEAVQNYERGAVYPLLLDILKPTLSALSQWKMDVEGKPGQVTATSEDMHVKSFVILAGRPFAD